jgi:hypothetical protein
MLLARLPAAEAVVLFARVAAALLTAVGGAVIRGGKSWIMLRCVNDGTSGQRRYIVSTEVSKYDPGISEEQP